jgi:hypothetical protein
MENSEGKQIQIRDPKSKKGKQRVAKFKNTDIQEKLMCAMTVDDWARELMEIIHSSQSSQKNKLDALTLFARYTFPTPSTQNVNINADVNKELSEWVRGDAIKWEDTDKDVIDIE